MRQDHEKEHVIGVCEQTILADRVKDGIMMQIANHLKTKQKMVEPIKCSTTRKTMNNN